MFDDEKRFKFLPLVFTRPIGFLRAGIGTVAEKWSGFNLEVIKHLVPEYLDSKFNPVDQNSSVFVNSRIIANESIAVAIRSLAEESTLTWKGNCLAFKTNTKLKFEEIDAIQASLAQVEFSGNCLLLEQVSDLFSHNEKFITDDFNQLTRGRTSADLHASVQVIGSRDQLFVESGAQMHACIINTTHGPVYIGKDSEVMEGCMVRGPFALCKNATLKMGAKIYGGTTVGPHCKVGGEVGNSVLMGYSNKGHDGYLGNSIIGEWCNLGADTNTSNLKNNYSSVKTWNYKEEKLTDSGLTFIGLIMGDHAKSAINTQFNTGTTVGCCANVFGSGFPPKFIPGFSWGGADGFVTFDLERSYEVADRVMARRSIDFTADDRKIFSHINDYSAKFRH